VKIYVAAVGPRRINPHIGIMVKFTKAIEMGFGVFIMIPMWGSIHPGRTSGGTQKRRRGKTR
jgi:hypothetical protein